MFDRFEDIWKFKDNDDPHDRYYKDVIERDKMVKIEQEIRNVVDELMRNELELLQAAYDRDRAFKGKKGKKPQKVSTLRKYKLYYASRGFHFKGYRRKGTQQVTLK